MTLNFDKLYPDDSLPTHVCSRCIQQVNNSYDFKVQCESKLENLLVMLVKNVFHTRNFSKGTLEAIQVNERLRVMSVERIFSNRESQNPFSSPYW
ncbi:hypothetical protein C0J52_08804 [Blattella germanica]|nr:hypothetical protein C0J52_08804 [Blattella germanica]